MTETPEEKAAREAREKVEAEAAAAEVKTAAEARAKADAESRATAAAALVAAADAALTGLVQTGRMTPARRREIETAIGDGTAVAALLADLATTPAPKATAGGGPGNQQTDPENSVVKAMEFLYPSKSATVKS